MFATIRTKTKILAAFAVALLIALVVGLVGYRGIGQLSAHVQDVGTQQLPSICGLNMIAKGQLTVGYGDRGLIERRMIDVKSRENQYRRIDDGLKQAAEGFTMYESQSMTPDEAAMWKELHEAWDAWLEKHQQIVKLSHNKDELLKSGLTPEDAKLTAIDEQAYAANDATRGPFNKCAARLEDLIKLNRQQADTAVTQATRDASFAIWSAVAVIVVGAVTMLLLALFLARGISRVLQALIGEAARVAQAATAGKLQTRGNVELVNAEFRPIIAGMNATLDVVVGFLDQIPMPAMIIGKEMDVLYMNDCGAEVIGLNKQQIVGTKCYQHFKTNHCNTGECACVRAMQQRQVVSAEATAHPNGQELEISYTGSPILDAAGNVVGALECVSDQTAVKRAARVSNKVAQFQSQQSQALTENLKKLSAGDLNLAVKVAEGDADTAAARESFVQIATAVQQVVQTLQNLSGDAKQLSQAAANGQLETRADEARYQGEYRQILHGMNQSLQGFEAPIRDIAQVLQRLADKDFSQPIEKNYPGAYGQLRDNVNAVVQNIRDAIEQITDSATQFAEGSRVIAESSQTLASGVQTQSSSVEQMTASIEELARSIAAVKENAAQATQVASQANRLAEQGGQAVQKSVESMGQIRTSSTQIAEIIQVISEIASQTNLLALNAAIEAARAGEHGMGFAVVADEVRKLAERSNQAAREISSLIKESTKRVEEGAQLSDQTGAALTQIITAAEATAAKIAEIATATVEQATNAEEVSRAIQGIAQVTEQSAAGSEQMASSSEELGAQASTLRALVGEFTVR